MTDFENGISGKSGYNNITNYPDEEINLTDYFLVLWKRKWFIFLASVLPALAIGLFLFLQPRDSKVSYTYNIGEKAFKVLEDKFYSMENLEKLVEKLQKGGFGKYANELAETKTAKELKEFISFEISSSSYLEVIRQSEAKDLEELKNIQQVQGILLVMRMEIKAEENIQEIALVCRKNFEQIIPLYSVREELNNKIMSLREQLASIEEERYSSNMQLERKKSTLEKLKNSGSGGTDKLPNDIVLQFGNVGGGAYLPSSYQIQAAETQIINLEEEIVANEEMYRYYGELLNLNEKLFDYIETVMPSYCTLEQFHLFLLDRLAEHNKENPQLLDYLKAYTKRVENKMANAVPLIEKPKVCLVEKGTIKKSGIVFAISLTASVFAALFLEGLKKSQAQSS